MRFQTLTDKKYRLHRAPRISFKEMCEEFGLSQNSLVNALVHKNGPKPVLVNNSTVRNSWYDAEEVRKWWKNSQ